MSQSFTNKNSKEAAGGITNISIEGFKSLESECNIEVRPLTILAGANSSGKSSVIQPLLLLKQTLEATYDPGALKLDGPNVKFTNASQIFSRIPGKPEGDSFTIKLTLDGGISLANTYGKSSDDVPEILEATIQENGVPVTFTKTMTREQIGSFLSNYYEELGINNVLNIFQLDKSEFFENLEWSINRDRCFLNFQCKYKKQSKIEEISWEHSLTCYESNSNISLFDNEIRRLIHVPGFRGNPERHYAITGIGATFPGTFEHYVATIINYWQKTEDSRLKELWKAMETLGLTSKVVAQKLNDIAIELLVSNLPGKGPENNLRSIADVGFGLSQILPVIVALIAAEPGQLVYLEQPEIHLHPRATAALGDLLVKAANRGVKVIVETHSDLLLRRVQSLVAEGKIEPENVKLHWFQLSDNGVTEIGSADMDDAGAYGEDWPEDFSDIALDEESRYLDAAEARLLVR
ncbi:MAG: AAA family ATPase [Cyanobacteriota bacterium]|nr:AAA family ATPase [Cyanobacteriota bacterium]